MDQPIQAERLVEAIRDCQRDYIELDFAGIEDANPAFTELFLRLAAEALPSVWLSPRHYPAAHNRLVKHLLGRLKRQRERAWASGCETFCSGSKA